MIRTPNKERIQKLVHALRTTKRQQGRNRLTRYVSANKKEYCCLGIACEVAIADGLGLSRKREQSHYETIVRYGDAESRDLHVLASSTSMLPDAVQDWYGFNEADPVLYSEIGTLVTATGLNDRRKYDFKRIADAFERTYLSE